jgi:arsenite oxidase small subunit
MSSSGEDDTKDRQLGKGTHESTEAPRRSFLKVGLAFAVGLVILGVGAITRSLLSPSEVLATESSTTTVSTPTTSQTGIQPSTPGFPVLMVANVSDLKVNEVVYFNYPLQTTNQASILVKLGTKASGGVGPDGDIVAFSQVCQHLGCDYGYVSAGGSPGCDSSYTAAGPVGYCCCHGSVYDLTKGAKVIAGPAPRPLPQVILKVDSSGNIYATGMTPPTIFGYDTGSNNVSADLVGGTPVG